MKQLFVNRKLLMFCSIHRDITDFKLESNITAQKTSKIPTLNVIWTCVCDSTSYQKSCCDARPNLSLTSYSIRVVPAMIAGNQNVFVFSISIFCYCYYFSLLSNRSNRNHPASNICRVRLSVQISFSFYVRVFHYQSRIAFYLSS